MLKQSNSKELVDMKKQEKIYFSVKDYDKAQAMRIMIAQQEILEAKLIQEKLDETLAKEEEKLKAKQQNALSTLLKRIQRDREE